MAEGTRPGCQNKVPGILGGPFSKDFFSTENCLLRVNHSMEQRLFYRASRQAAADRSSKKVLHARTDDCPTLMRLALA
jgi:hypothetical protein